MRNELKDLRLFFKSAVCYACIGLLVETTLLTVHFGYSRLWH
jgi:hypothetical protein